MSTREQEAELLKSYNYMALVTRDNFPVVDYVILMKDYHENTDRHELSKQLWFVPQPELEYLVRLVNDRARVLAIVKGTVIDFNRRHFYYGLVKTVTQFCTMVYGAVFNDYIGSDHLYDKLAEAMKNLETYFGDELTADETYNRLLELTGQSKILD